MRKFLLLLLVFCVATYLFGCGQKKKEEETFTMDDLGAINIEQASVNELKPEAAAKTDVVVSELPAPAAETIAPPPTAEITAKPSSLDIQTALKNAGFYIAEIDGKIGRMTKKAVEDFQEANNLTADGKVGPQTWAVLSKFLSMQPVAAKKKR